MQRKVVNGIVFLLSKLSVLIDEATSARDPNLLKWNCKNHHLQLAVSDDVVSVNK